MCNSNEIQNDQILRTLIQSVDDFEETIQSIKQETKNINLRSLTNDILCLKFEVKKLKEYQNKNNKDSTTDETSITSLIYNVNELKQTLRCIEEEIQQLKSDANRYLPKDVSKSFKDVKHLKYEVKQLKQYSLIENEVSSLKKTIDLLNNDIGDQNNNNELEIFKNYDDEIDKQQNKLNLEINKFRENVVIINAYWTGSESQNNLEDKIYELKQNIKELIKQKTNLEQEIKENRNIEKEIEANCNDLVRCLHDTHNKEQKIQLLLHQKKNNKNYNQENNEEEIESVNNQNNNQIIKMNNDEKVIYFNKLVTDESQNKFDISVHDFFVLTQNIGSVDENQFNYMIDYYKYKQSKGDNDSQIIFNNLEQIDTIQLKKLLNLNSFCQFLPAENHITRVFY